jgi:hypothetical protein
MLIDPNFKPKTNSLLGRQHFQNAYVTTDLERALATFKESHGIEEFFLVHDFALPMGGVIDVAMAWSGNVNLEVIQPRGNRNSLYERWLPETGFALQFHHFGYVIPDQASWDSLLATIEEKGREIVFSGRSPDGLDWVYIHAPELGHYLEYVYPSPAWIELYDTIPRF